jgi:hypothetical protein
MDSYREHPSDFDLSPTSVSTAADDVAAAIGTDERRMHVRAYNYWVSLLDGRDFPSIEDLDPAHVQDFAGNSLLLDFTCGRDNPAMPYIGAAIRDECGLDDDMRTIAEVPSRSLLSRLTDHYMQIIANRAPVGFEAEFDNQRAENICYRGILMPFSSDGDTIDFIYGVINWKKGRAAKSAQAAEQQIDDVSAPAFEPEIEAAVETPAEPVVEEVAPVEQPPMPAEHFSWDDGPLADADEEAVPEIALGDDAGLADRLWAARETAEAVKSGEGRTRAALYQALSLAYDFAIAAQADPAEYAELLEESGVKAQARAPMTPVVKLVFGIDYDKTRLTEFAAALSYAQREQVEAGAFQSFIEKQPGGLKALVSLERQARQPEPKPDTKTEQARAKLRSAAPLSLADLPSDDEFALVIVRRTPDGGHEPVAMLSDPALVQRAIRKAV